MQRGGTAAFLLGDVGQSNVLHDCTRVKPRVSACKPMCAILSARSSGVPDFECESKRRQFVSDCMKCNGFGKLAPQKARIFCTAVNLLKSQVLIKRKVVGRKRV